MPHLSCKRCGYGWTPRSDQAPDVCPSCKSRKWNVQRTSERAVEDLTPVQRRMVESVLRIIKLGTPTQVRGLSLMVEAQDSLLRQTEDAKAGKKK